jgi:hypothetical protein
VARPSRIGCAVASAGNLPWAWAGSAAFNVPSAGWPNTTIAAFGALGTFFTNDPATFASETDGIDALRGGMYVSFHFGLVNLSSAITAGTVRAWVFAMVPAYGSTVDTLTADFYNPYMNASLTGATPDASPQRWVPSEFAAQNIPEVGPTFPLAVWGVRVGQETGSPCSCEASLFVMRIADGIP